MTSPRAVSPRSTGPDDASGLRVLRVIARLNVGGPARHTVILDHGLRTLGAETLLVHGSTGPMEASLEDFARQRGVAVTHVAELGRRIHPFDDLRAFARVMRLVWKWQPDVVHTHTAKAGVVGRLAALVYNATRARARRCAVVHTFHGHVFSNYFGTAGSFAVRVIERTFARVTDRIVAISDTQRDDLVSRFAIARPGQVSVVPLGLELDGLLQRAPAFRGRRAEWGFSDGDVVVGYVGRLVPVKDVGTLIRAVALAGQRLPRLKMVIAGDGECRQSLEQLVRELDIPDRVRFVGWQRDLLQLYAAFDIFALSSLNEGTPVALIEAMAAGVPVVATAVGGVADVVRHDETGILVPPRNPSALADAINRTATQPLRSAQLAERARTIVASRYGADRLVTDILGLYKTVVTQKRGTLGATPLPVAPSERTQY
jgi:glycosyltransferase involved in cell wall biosynthesis